MGLREDDGWRRLELYFADQIRTWAKCCKDLHNPAMAKLGNDLLQRHQEQEATKWKDASGNTIKPAPDLYQILKGIEGHDAPRDHTIGKDSGRIMYTVFYRMICRPAHAHVEPLTGNYDTMYLNTAGYGTCLAATALLTASIHRASQSPASDVSDMLKRFLPLLVQVAFGNG